MLTAHGLAVDEFDLSAELFGKAAPDLNRDWLGLKILGSRPSHR
jgi:hypothetical protein